MMNDSIVIADEVRNEELLTYLKDWAAGGVDQILVPELLEASTEYSGVIEDELVSQLLERLQKWEGRPRMWLQYAFSIFAVYKKAGSTETKLKFLTYIYDYNEKIAISWQKNSD